MKSIRWKWFLETTTRVPGCHLLRAGPGSRATKLLITCCGSQLATPRPFLPAIDTVQVTSFSTDNCKCVKHMFVFIILLDIKLLLPLLGTHRTNVLLLFFLYRMNTSHITTIIKVLKGQVLKENKSCANRPFTCHISCLWHKTIDCERSYWILVVYLSALRTWLTLFGSWCPNISVRI